VVLVASKNIQEVPVYRIALRQDESYFVIVVENGHAHCLAVGEYGRISEVGKQIGQL